ncbi:MAG: hypothetical protein ACO23R_18530 [bacterium]
MNFYQANKILDRVRDGENYSIQTINKALELTGDLEPRGIEELGSSGMDQQVQEEDQRPWGIRSPSMVAKDVIRHSSDSWAISR